MTVLPHRWLLRAPGNLRARLGALLKIRAPDLSSPSKPPKKELTSAKNWKIPMRRNSDRPACVATRQRQDAEIISPTRCYRLLLVVFRSAIVRRRKESGSPWFQSWLPSPRRGHGSETETSGARLQKRPRQRWSREVTRPHREPSRDGQVLP